MSAGEVRPINLMLAETIPTRLTAAGYVFNVPEEKFLLEQFCRMFCFNSQQLG